MWVLDRQRLQSELRRQGLTLEALIAEAELDLELGPAAVDIDARELDEDTIAKLAAALGVQPIDISHGTSALTDAAFDSRVASRCPSPEEGEMDAQPNRPA